MQIKLIAATILLILTTLGVMYLIPVSKQGDRTLYGGVVELETPGGPLPFELSYHRTHTSEFGLTGWVENGFAEKVPVVIESQTNDTGNILVTFPHYDSVLELKSVDDGPMTGSWRKNRGSKGAAIMDAKLVDDRRDVLFASLAHAEDDADFEGRWSVKFESSEGLSVGQFYTIDLDEFVSAQGTFMTTTGDYRFLAGRVDGNLMRLSTFDGAHAFLFHARMQDDGTIEGDFWSGNWWHETWTAVRDDDAALPDAFEQTTIADEDALDDMVFKNLQGEPTRVLDVLDQSNGGRGAPARIIEIFGTWCPNCSDAGRELVSLREQYGDDLAVVGLAFEVTEDFERSVQQVKHHHEHIGTDWPILIAGLSDKDKASQALPVLDKVRSYPTLIFLDRNNAVQGVYSGFSGPATGDAYTKQRERFEKLIESMID
jgi:thiol-disulfide isomerase/thioredoxin